MTAYVVPLSPAPKRLSIFLSGVEYNLRFVWSNKSAAWIMDIADVNGVPLMTGVPLVTGSDLLAQFAYLGVYGQMVAQTDNAPGTVPTFENLGLTSQLYYLSDLAQ